MQRRTLKAKTEPLLAVQSGGCPKHRMSEVEQGRWAWEKHWNLILQQIARGTERYIKRYLFLLLFCNKVVTQLENALSRRLDCNENQVRLIYQWYPREQPTPGACRQFHASPFLSGVGEGAPCHPADWITVAVVFGEFFPFWIKWEGGLHPTREDHQRTWIFWFLVVGLIFKLPDLFISLFSIEESFNTSVGIW